MPILFLLNRTPSVGEKLTAQTANLSLQTCLKKTFWMLVKQWVKHQSLQYTLSMLDVGGALVAWISCNWRLAELVAKTLVYMYKLMQLFSFRCSIWGERSDSDTSWTKGFPENPELCCKKNWEA